MSTHLLHPTMAGLLDRIERARRKPFHAMAVDEARAAYRSAAEVLDLPRAPLAEVRDLVVQAATGHALPARLYRPGPGRRPVLLYLHGGGFVIGGLETHDSLCRQLARRSGGVVLALDYRLAPEHRFPAAIDDTWSALQWLREQGEAWDLDVSRIAVGGDSAGGTLAAVAAIHARDRGWPLSMQLLITPGTAAAPTTGSHRLFGRGFLLDAATIEWFFDHSVDRHQRHDWRFAPLETDDLAGVAPACVVLAECDPLVDEGLAYADRLRMAGVPVQLDLVRGVVHDFIKMGRALAHAGQAQQFAADALRSAWGQGDHKA